MLVAAGWFSRDVREGIGVGFLGGFTTFSGGIAAAVAGYILGRKLTAYS